MYLALSQRFAARLLAVLTITAVLPIASAQTSNVGSVAVTVADTSGAFVPGAQLQLRDLETNDIRKAETQAGGIYTFPNLNFGTYELSVSKQGFDTVLFSAVQVQTGRVTSISATLKIG